MTVSWGEIIPVLQPRKRSPTTLKKIFYALSFGLGVTMTTITATQMAQAALGEPADSVEADRKTMSAARGETTAREGYTVQTVESDSTTVREYISPSGVVFGIAWNGLTHPDLMPLLGSYADEYDHALRKASREPGRRHLQIKTNRIVVEKWGHMRNLQGRSYAIDLIPPGVSVDDIK